MHFTFIALSSLELLSMECLMDEEEQEEMVVLDCCPSASNLTILSAPPPPTVPSLSSSTFDRRRWHRSWYSSTSYSIVPITSIDLTPIGREFCPNFAFLLIKKQSQKLME